jgi:hypothetical protein
MQLVAITAASLSIPVVWGKAAVCDGFDVIPDFHTVYSRFELNLLVDAEPTHRNQDTEDTFDGCCTYFRDIVHGGDDAPGQLPSECDGLEVITQNYQVRNSATNYLRFIYNDRGCDIPSEVQFRDDGSPGALNLVASECALDIPGDSWARQSVWGIPAGDTFNETKQNSFALTAPCCKEWQHFLSTGAAPSAACPLTGIQCAQLEIDSSRVGNSFSIFRLHPLSLDLKRAAVSRLLAFRTIVRMVGETHDENFV